jgi:hypothetical protein
MLNFNALLFLEDCFRDAHGVMAAVARHAPDNPLKKEAVDKWFSRQSVPSSWLPVLILAHEAETGQRVDIRRYCRETPHDIFA